MKIIEDKVVAYPPHSLCKKDVEMLVKTIPEEWTTDIDTIRLSNALPYAHGGSPPALVLRYARSVTICSRGLDKEVVVRETLRELSANARGLRTRRHHFTERDLKILDAIVQPLVDEIVPRLSKKKVWLDS